MTALLLFIVTYFMICTFPFTFALKDARPLQKRAELTLVGMNHELTPEEGRFLESAIVAAYNDVHGSGMHMASAETQATTRYLFQFSGYSGLFIYLLLLQLVNDPCRLCGSDDSDYEYDRSSGGLRNGKWKDPATDIQLGLGPHDHIQFERLLCDLLRSSPYLAFVDVEKCELRYVLTSIDLRS